MFEWLYHYLDHDTLDTPWKWSSICSSITQICQSKSGKRELDNAKVDFLKVLQLDKENEIANWELGKIYFDTNIYLDFLENRNDRLRPLGELASQLFKRSINCEFFINQYFINKGLYHLGLFQFIFYPKIQILVQISMFGVCDLLSSIAVGLNRRQ